MDYHLVKYPLTRFDYLLTYGPSFGFNMRQASNGWRSALFDKADTFGFYGWEYRMNFRAFRRCMGSPFLFLTRVCFLNANIMHNPRSLIAQRQRAHLRFWTMSARFGFESQSGWLSGPAAFFRKCRKVIRGSGKKCWVCVEFMQVCCNITLNVQLSHG